MSTVPQQSRQHDASIRQQRRDKLSPSAQIAIVAKRPGHSAREITRLSKQL